MPPLPEPRQPDELPAFRDPGMRAIPPQAAAASRMTPADAAMSVGEWLITIIILAIPILNIVMYVYWAFFSRGNQDRINFCRASLIILAVGILLAVLLPFLSVL